MLDATLRLETPEGVDLALAPAGPVVRGLAASIDGLITWGGSILALIALSSAGRTGTGVSLLLLFGVQWFYPVLFEVLGGGRTPGKRAMGLRVIDADATPIGWNASLVRNLLRVVDLLPAFYAAGLVSMLVGSRFQRLGDLVAGTLVIHAPSVGPPPRDGPASDDRLGARSCPVLVRAADQRAILAWSERRGQLSDERAVELSDLLAPLTGAVGEAGRDELVRIANGIRGST